MPSKRKSIGVVGAALAAGALSATSVRAQTYEAPPPISVPTDPVPQKLDPLTQGGPTATAKSKKAPAPSAAPTPAPAPTSAPPPVTTSTPTSSGEGSPPTTFNNEGTFKVSGTSGSGAAGGAPTKGKTTTFKGKGKIAAKPKVEAPIAEWPGFRMTEDGGSEVMVEFSKAVGAPTEHKTAGSITYVFPGALVTKHNNENPLLTIHFDTPVLDARLVTVKGELHLVVELRPGMDVAALTGMRPATEGTKQQFFVKFPAGSYLPPNDALDKNPNAKTEQGKAAFEKGDKGKKGKAGTGTTGGKGPNP